MRLVVFIFFLSFFISCNVDTNSKEDKVSILQNMSLLFMRNNKLTISGTAVKGIVKNAIVTVTPLNSDGSCNTSVRYVSGITDDTGNYSISFNKTGGVVCLFISPNPNGRTTVFDEKTNSDVLISANSKFNLVSILPENRIIENSRKNAMVSPFSKLIARRLQVLAIDSATSNISRDALYKKAGREVVIRFGLSNGLFSASRNSKENTGAIKSQISETDYPDLDEILIELENPNSPMTAKFISILVGFSHLANKYKKGGVLSIEDIDSIIEAFAVDFEDGFFDGKTISGQPITIGSGATQLTFSSNPLTTILHPAILSYVQEGGTLNVGKPGVTTPSISSTQLQTQIQFVDNAIITSNIINTATAPTISFTTNVFSPTQNAVMTPITPTVSGTISSCTSSPALPSGITINSSTCVISGTPLTRVTSSLYTITASGPAGSASASITLAVIPSTFLKIFVTAGSLGPNLVGPSGDSTCNADGNKPGGGGTYKALAALTTRRACLTSNCSGGASENSNWILYPNTQYRRGDGTTIIGTTNASAIFTFNLTNSIAAAGFPSTFLNVDWTQNATENCSDGTSLV